MSKHDTPVHSDWSEDGKGEVRSSAELAGRMGKSLRWYWTLATVLGMVLGGILRVVVAKESFYITITWLIIGGVMVGTIQSLPLRQVIYQTRQWVLTSGQWILASAIGWIVGWFATVAAMGAISILLMIIGIGDYTIFYDTAESLLPTILAVILGATGVSILQQRILRKRLGHTKEWIWMSIVGWCAGWAVGLGVAHITPGTEIAKSIAGGVSGGIVLGIITGNALTRLLGNFRTETCL